MDAWVLINTQMQFNTDNVVSKQDDNLKRSWKGKI